MDGKQEINLLQINGCGSVAAAVQVLKMILFFFFKGNRPTVWDKKYLKTA